MRVSLIFFLHAALFGAVEPHGESLGRGSMVQGTRTQSGGKASPQARPAPGGSHEHGESVQLWTRTFLKVLVVTAIRFIYPQPVRAAKSPSDVVCTTSEGLSVVPGRGVTELRARRIRMTLLESPDGGAECPIRCLLG